MARIMCSVDNCHYWGKGNICEASEIFVCSDQLAADQPDSYDAPMAGTANPTPVNQCMETACKTFVPKGSTKKKVDDVFRNPY